MGAESAPKPEKPNREIEDEKEEQFFDALGGGGSKYPGGYYADSPHQLGPTGSGGSSEMDLIYD